MKQSTENEPVVTPRGEGTPQPNPFPSMVRSEAQARADVSAASPRISDARAAEASALAEAARRVAAAEIERRVAEEASEELRSRQHDLRMKRSNTAYFESRLAELPAQIAETNLALRDVAFWFHQSDALPRWRAGLENLARLQNEAAVVEKLLPAVRGDVAEIEARVGELQRSLGFDDSNPLPVSES